ncbi:hypothetical protein Btru_043503 [Bulinus truncatus]|nr:hypothetical protein Btru_043503 [Bulinus truncatus]
MQAMSSMALSRATDGSGSPSKLDMTTTLDTVFSTDVVHENVTWGRHFIPLSDAGFTFIGCMLGFTFVVGSFSNGLCLFVFVRNRRLRSPTNVFVMALNLVDFLMCFTVKDKGLNKTSSADVQLSDRREKLASEHSLGLTIDFTLFVLSDL